jgi:hypothetical protein
LRSTLSFNLVRRFHWGGIVPPFRDLRSAIDHLKTPPREYLETDYELELGAGLPVALARPN